MRRNSNTPSTEANEALAEQIRANVAFEHIAVAVLAGAGVCGAAIFFLQLALSIANGVGITAAALSAIFAALVFALLFFLVGFAAGAVIVTPLFRLLENAKRRSGWPYGAVALAVAMSALIIAGALPGVDAPGLASIVAVIGASIATSVIFARRMKPLWIAAEAEDRAKESAPITFRLQ